MSLWDEMASAISLSEAERKPFLWYANSDPTLERATKRLVEQAKAREEAEVTYLADARICWPMANKKPSKVAALKG